MTTCNINSEIFQCLISGLFRKNCLKITQSLFSQLPQRSVHAVVNKSKCLNITGYVRLKWKFYRNAIFKIQGTKYFTCVLTLQLKEITNMFLEVYPAWVLPYYSSTWCWERKLNGNIKAKVTSMLILIKLSRRNCNQKVQIKWKENYK